MEFKEIASNNPRRDFNIMTYYPPEVFKPVFEKYGKYVYILHNKDDKTDHYHVALKTKNAVTLNRLHDLVDFEYANYCDRLNIEYNRQRMTAYPLRDESIETAIDYYLHTNEDSVNLCKHQYHLNEIRGNYDFIGKYNKVKLRSEEAHDNETFYNDLTKKYKNEHDLMVTLAKKYGRDFIKNYTKYRDFRIALCLEEREANIQADLDEIGDAVEEYFFFEESASFQSVEAYRQDLQKKLDALNKRYPKPEFTTINIKKGVPISE